MERKEQMTQSDTFCSKCGHVITDEASSIDPAQRKLCSKCDALTQTNYLSGKSCAKSDVIGSSTIITYPQKLLSICKGLIENGEYSIAVVVAHIACEVATERTLSSAFESKGLQYLEGPVLDFLNGYSLANERNRKLYTAITDDNIEQQSFWQAFKESATRRNRIIHRGSIVKQTEAQSSYEAASDFVTHLNE